jgi:hypothetical protein
MNFGMGARRFNSLVKINFEHKLFQNFLAGWTILQSELLKILSSGGGLALIAFAASRIAQSISQFSNVLHKIQ